MANKPSKGIAFALEIQFEGQPDKPIEIDAFLFDRTGNLVASAPFEKGQAQFALERAPIGARLFVGPSLGETQREGPPSLSTMERLNAFEPGWTFELERTKYELRPIPDFHWPHWPLCKCHVRGRVVKRSYSPGGVVVEAPVCNARVHVCEVDRLFWVISRLPSPDILRLRDDLFDIIRHPIPWPPIPEPDPWPFADLRPDVVDPTDRREQMLEIAAAVRLFGGARGELVALNPQPLPPKYLHGMSSVNSAALNPQPLPPVDIRMLASQVLSVRNDGLQLQLPASAQFSLSSKSVEMVRRGLLDHIEFLRPWICHWHWLDFWFYTCDELRVVMTDDDGRFDTTIWYPCFGDKPDLYFWVEYSVGGTWTTVHRPPVRCHIWWDYQCGTEVTIAVTDPRVSGCGDRPPLLGKHVVVKTIGREVSMGEINREPPVIDPSYPGDAGTVKVGWINSSRVSPFGEVVEPRVDFGTGLKPAGITHYSWSYRTLGSILESDWKKLQDTVTRHYRETTPPLAPAIYKSVLVGPDQSLTGYFFEVEPALPAGGEKFEVLDERIDLASARWDTSTIPAGKYELKLELFRKVGGVMTRVDLTAEGVGLSQIVDPAPLSEGTYTTQLATGDRLLVDPGTGHTVGFRLVVHLDNRVCSGTIEPVTVAPGANDTKCGFLEYGAGALATIRFRASHPANFASFGFSVARVATLLSSASATGLVDDVSANGFSRTGDLFTKAIAVSTLLSEDVPADETPCIRAAFAESLHVYALATNGYGRLSYLDAPRVPAEIALRGFAVTPS